MVICTLPGHSRNLAIYTLLGQLESLSVQGAFFCRLQAIQHVLLFKHKHNLMEDFYSIFYFSCMVIGNFQFLSLRSALVIFDCFMIK